MIFALRHPAVLLGLLVGFLVGVALRAAVQRALASGGGLRPRRRLRAVGGAHRSDLFRPGAGWSAYLDPYGAVAAFLGGVGWGARVPSRRTGRGSDVWLLVAAVVVHGALAAAGFAAYRAASGVPLHAFSGVDATVVLYGSDFSKAIAPTFVEAVTLGFGMINLACALLALLPIPPLELGVLLWSRLPRSASARRFAYHLLEEAWGVAVVLLLLLLPVAGQKPVILSLIDTVTRAIFGQF